MIETETPQMMLIKGPLECINLNKNGLSRVKKQTIPDLQDTLVQLKDFKDLSKLSTMVSLFTQRV